ncbi:TonB-dependent receptor [Paracidovorax avenae]
MSRQNFRPAPLALAIAFALGASAVGAQGAAQPDAPVPISIPPQPLADALNGWARQTRIQLIAPQGLVTGKTAPAVSGTLTPNQALNRLLSGSGLIAAWEASAVVIKAAPPFDGGLATLAPVTVTGKAERGDGLPEAYAGGQVARGGRLGILGNVDVMDAPFNTTNYTSELIDNQQAATLADVLKNDPSVTISQSSAISNPGNFIVRGFTANTNSSTYDGVSGMMPWWGAFPAEFIERVEVLKGPNALLNGMSPAGTVGGTVNLVPKRAGDNPLTRLTLGMESDALWTSHLDAGRRFGANGEWGVRFNGSYKNGEGYIDDQKRESYAGALALDYRGERVRLTLDSYRFQQEMHGGGPLIAYAASGLTSLPDAPDGSTNMLPNARESKSTTSALILGGEYDFNDRWTAYAKLGVSHDDIPAMWSGNMTTQANGAGSLSITAWPSDLKSKTAQAGLRGRFQTGEVSHAVSLSASYLKQDEYSYRNFGVARPSNIYMPAPIVSWQTTPNPLPKSDERTLGGVALADTLGFMDDRVLLTMGVRRQNVKDTAFAKGVVSSAYDEGVWSPMVGLVLKPTGTLSLYANHIEGLSAGTVVGPAFANASEVFPPYKTKQSEIGAKLQTGSYTNTISLFQIARPSVIADNSTTPPTARLDGEQRNRGIEWATFGELTRGLRALGGVTYLQGKQTRTQGGLNDGNQAPGAPRWTVKLGTDWDVPGLLGLALNGRVTYTSAQYVDNANVLKIPSWTVFDVGARYAARLGGKGVVFRANVENLFNKNYWQGVGAALSGSVVLGAPRTFRLSAAIDF